MINDGAEAHFSAGINCFWDKQIKEKSLQCPDHYATPNNTVLCKKVGPLTHGLFTNICIFIQILPDAQKREGASYNCPFNGNTNIDKDAA